MENDVKTSNNKENAEKMILTANEVANTVGENYKSVVKMLDTLATNGEIGVTEKHVNNRALKGYVVRLSDIQNIKNKFLSKKHSEKVVNEALRKMRANDMITDISADISNNLENNTNVKFYEVMTENSDLKRELSEIKESLQKVKNENVQLNADLTVERSKVKFIEDKSNTIEADNSKQRLEIERLQKVVNNRNIALLLLGAVLLVIVAVALTLTLAR